MWIQPSQRNKLKGLSSDARTPVLQFLQARPTLIRTLQRDSPHLGEAFKLAPYETEQWETLAEILMEACIANPAASMELHEVLYGVITPAGHGFWGQNAFKKLMSPLSSIVGFGQQAFRNNQPRDLKQSVSQSDSEDFQIGTSRSDSMESQPQTEIPAASAARSKLPPKHASVSINGPAPASDRLGAADVSPLAKSAVSSNVPAKSELPSISTTDKRKRTASTPSHPLEQHMGSTAPVPVPKPGKPAAQASLSAAASSQQAADARKQPNAASSSGRQQPTVSESKQLETQEAAQAPEASSSQPQAVHDERTNQSDAEKQRQSAAGSCTTSSAGEFKPTPLETIRQKRRERPTSIPIPADASCASPTLSPRGSSKRALTAAKPPLHPSPLDARADQEPWFPMPVRTSRMSLALPSQDRSPKRRVPLDPFLASLPDPKKMTEKELLEFDFGAIERRLDELSRKNKTGRYATPPKGSGPSFSASASSATPLTDACNKYSELDTDDLPSLSSWLADTEATLRDPDWGASLGSMDVPLMNGLPPPSVLQAQLRELTSQASVFPSRLDQLKFRKVPTASSSESASTVQSKDSPAAMPEVLPAAATATASASSDKEEGDQLLEELMEPAQRQPYREFKRDMEERAKAREAARLRGISTTLPDLAPGAVPSLGAARNALETFQKERMATVGSVSEPLARAQAQLAELEVSLAKDRQQPLPWAELEATLQGRNGPPTHDSTTRITDAVKPQVEAARRSSEARKAAWAAYKEKDSHLPEDFKRRMDEVYNPSEEHTAAVAVAVKLGVEDFKSGRVANRSEAVRARVSEVYKRRDPLLRFPKDPVPSQAEASEGPSSTFSAYRSSGQISPTPEVFKPSLPTVAEGSSVTHLDPEVDIPDPLDLSPPLGSVPMLPGLRGIQRPAMRPSQPRGARPGRGPVPVPSTTHPEARPYGVARSSLALREQAQLQAEQPGALLMPPRHKSASSDKCPEKLPTPEAAVNLLAQVHSAEKRFETTLPNGKPPTPIVTAAAVLGADAVDQTMVAKFVKETALVPQKPTRPAPKASKSAAPGSTPQAGSASPQAASLATVAEHPVAAAATTISEPAADAAAPAPRKSKKVKAAGTQPSSSVAQPQAQAPAASQPAGLPTQSPSEARAEQSVVPAATQPAFKDQAAPVSAAAVASASAVPVAAVPSASSTATSSSPVQPGAPLVRSEVATEGSLTPPDADPSSPTGEQASASKQGKQRMGKKQREKQRQEAAAKAVEDARIKAEQDAEQAAKDAAQAAKDAEYAEKRRIIQENVDKVKRNEKQTGATLAAVKAIEDAANAAKQAAPAASEVEDAAAQAAAEEAKQAKKQAKKQRKREEAKAAKLALAAKVVDQQQVDVTQAQDQAGPSDPATASEAAVPAIVVGLQPASGKAAQQSAQPADQNTGMVQSVAAADSHSTTPSRASSDSLQLASPAVPSEAHSSLPDNLRPKPKPGKKCEKPGKAKNAPVAVLHVDTEPSSEEPSSSQQQQQPSEAGTSQASSDFNAFLDSIGQQQQSVFAAQEDYRSALHDQHEDSADSWTTVNGHQQHRQPAEAVQESEEDWIAVSGAQQHRHTADADHASAEPWTTVASHQQQRHPVESQDIHAYAHQEDNGSELPADGDQHDNGPIGLALLEGGPPQRRRGTRAGKRHKKRYGDAAQRAQAQAVRDYVHASTWSDNDSDSTAGDRLQAHHPRTPLAAGHTTSDSPARAGSGPAPPPGLHRMDWAAAARGGDGALPKEGADAIVRQLKAQQEEEAAKAAELDLGSRPKPKPRAGPVGSAPNRAPRVPAASDEAVAAANAAALAATAGIVRSQTRRSKQASAAVAASPAPWGYTGDEAAEGSGDGMWETAESPSIGNAWEQPKQGRKSRQDPALEAVPLPAPNVAAPNADFVIPAADLAEILHEELEENFCCPLTLDILQDPVKAADGRTYERKDITDWLSKHDTSPMTNVPMPNKELAPDRELIRKMERLQRRIAAAEKRAAGEAA
ncbi:TPA: hypothetical protein ACH3X1_013923 [Trebouxia sp. C0004]